MKRENIREKSWLDSGCLSDNLILNEENFNKFWDLHPNFHAQVKIYGKLVEIPRFQQSYLRDYNFSGVEAKTIPLPEEFIPYLHWANSLGYGEFNQFLVNWYDNNHYIGPHADDERQLVRNSPIITITLCLPGEPRKFRIRNKNKEIVKDVKTTNGMVLVMGGEFQKEFKHEIVKVTGKNSLKVGKRISITLRQFV